MIKNLPKIFSAISLYKDGIVEVIVSDDGSEDDSVNVLEDLKVKMNSIYPSISFKIVKNNRNEEFCMNSP